jgi:hypothetical protein
MTFRVDWDEDAGEELMRLPAARRAVMSGREAGSFRRPARLTAHEPGQGQPGRDLRAAASLGPVAMAGAVSASCRRDGDTGVAPEAEHDRRGFDRAVRRAEERLKEIEG